MKLHQWQMSDELSNYIKDLFSCIGQTKVVEDGFHFERNAEHYQSNRRMTNDRVWMVPVERKVA
eukprot:761418-Lingulodinium_polyedra.AAC.1